MKILVTGGAGFIASHVVDSYIRLGHKVVIIDNLSTGRKAFINKKAVFYHADIQDRGKVDHIFRIEKPEVVNHHAAQISVRVSVENPALDAGVNLLGLLNILESARKYNVKKIIFASSGGAVYGDADEFPTSEECNKYRPMSPYGVAKLASEYYLHYYYQTYQIPYVALRYSNVYGPRQNPHGEAGVVAIFSLKLIKNETPVINGDGKQTRDYIYVQDVVKSNVAALKLPVFGAFNIGTGIQTNVIDIFEKLRKYLKSKTEVKYGPEKLGEQKRSCLNNNLAKREMKWKPETSIDRGLKETVYYFQKYE